MSKQDIKRTLCTWCGDLVADKPCSAENVIAAGCELRNLVPQEMRPKLQEINLHINAIHRHYAVVRGSANMRLVTRAVERQQAKHDLQVNHLRQLLRECIEHPMPSINFDLSDRIKAALDAANQDSAPAE